MRLQIADPVLRFRNSVANVMEELALVFVDLALEFLARLDDDFGGGGGSGRA